MHNKKLCLIYNTAPLYREAIFRAIDAEYDCDWYFGETKTDIKEMDTSLLKNVHYYKTGGNPLRWYWKRGVIKLLFKKKYQRFFMLAETRSITDWIFFGLAATFFKKKQIYIWTHGWYGKEVGKERTMKLWLYRHVNGVFVYGNYARNLLIKEGIPADKLFTIHNSLNYARQKSIRDSLVVTDIYRQYFGNENPVIVFIGRLTPVKKLDMLIDAVSDLHKQGKVYNLVFVGDGERKVSLMEMVKEKGIEDSVWFYGASYDESVNASLIYNADLCVSPGNVGLTAMHSLVFGTPVITHNDFEWQMPEFEAITENVTGAFFEKDSVPSLTKTIADWYINHGSEREMVRKACFNEIDNYWTPDFQMDVIRKNLIFDK